MPLQSILLVRFSVARCEFTWVAMLERECPLERRVRIRSSVALVRGKETWVVDVPNEKGVIGDSVASFWTWIEEGFDAVGSGVPAVLFAA